MTHEFQHVYRPTKLSEVVGQGKITNQLIKFLKNDVLPHTLLFAGPSGCGKTTIARILKGRLGCSDHDFREINAADTRGIDTIREIKSRVNLMPANGRSRIWLIDECHKLSNDAQTAFLKILEDVPKHVYFFLCTTEPEKLITAVRSRATLMSLSAVPDKDLSDLLTSIVTRENVKIGVEVIDKIVEVAGGSAREAVKQLHSVILLKDDEERLASVEDPEGKRQAFDLFRAMIYQKAKWPKVAEILKELNVPKNARESFRHFLISCARTEMLKAGQHSHRAFQLLDIIKTPWTGYEEVGLEQSCYEFLHSK